MGLDSPSMQHTSTNSFDPEPDSFPKLSLPPKLFLKKKKPRSDQLVHDTNRRLSSKSNSVITTVGQSVMNLSDELQLDKNHLSTDGSPSASEILPNTTPKKPPKVPKLRDTKRKGLRHFAIRVRNKVEQKTITTYNEVADELLEEERNNQHQQTINTNQSISNSGPVIDEKNIRRRVYDSLNVLMAMGIIRKEKKLIIWQGLTLAYASQQASELSDLRNFVQQKRYSMQQKRLLLEKTRQQYARVMSIVERNKTLQMVEGEQQFTDIDSILSHGEKLPVHHQFPDRLAFPFILVSTPANAKIELKMDERRESIHFSFDKAFSMFDDREVVRRMNFVQDTQFTDIFTTDGEQDIQAL